MSVYTVILWRCFNYCCSVWNFKFKGIDTDLGFRYWFWGIKMVWLRGRYNNKDHQPTPHNIWKTIKPTHPKPQKTMCTCHKDKKFDLSKKTKQEKASMLKECSDPWDHDIKEMNLKLSSKYTISKDIIGQGATAKIFKAYNWEISQICAVKMIDKFLKILIFLQFWHFGICEKLKSFLTLHILQILT